MSRIALIGDNSIGYVKSLIDIWNTGGCAVLIDWRIPFETAMGMIKEAGVKKCYIERDMLLETQKEKYASITFIQYERMNEKATTLPLTIYDVFAESYSQEEAVIIYSSGTTGKSKGIVLSHYAINTNADAIISYMRPTSNDSIYICKTLSHSSTLVGELLVALKSKIGVVIAPVIVPPRYVLDNIYKFNITFLCVNPILLSMYADAYDRLNYHFTNLRAIYVSGSILSDKVYEKAHRVFYNIPIYNVYGLTEAGPRVSAQTERCCNNNSVGKPINGVEVIVVDEKGKLVAPEMRGIIHVKTPSYSSGYVTGGQKHSVICSGWLNTGDIGFFDSLGELHIVERADDVIINNSHKVYPSDVERIIMEDSSIIDCAVCGCTVNGTEMIGCLYVSAENRQKDIIHRLKCRIPHYEIPKAFLRIGKIPRNSRGKINRTAIADTLSNYKYEG